jgi:hypothetical protein
MASQPPLPQFQFPEIPDPMAEYGKTIALKNMLLQQQATRQQMAYQQQIQPLQVEAEQNQLETQRYQLQLQKQAAEDRVMIGQIWRGKNGDLNETQKAVLAPDSKVSPQGAMQFMQEGYELQAKRNAMDKGEADAHVAASSLFGPALQAMDAQSVPDQTAQWPQFQQMVAGHPNLQRYLPHIPDQYPGPQWIKDALNGMTTYEQFDKNRTFAAEQGPYSDDQRTYFNNLIDKRQTEMGVKPDPSYHLLPGMGPEQLKYVHQFLQQAEQAKATQAQREFTNTMARLQLQWKQNPYNMFGNTGNTMGPPAIPGAGNPPAVNPAAPTTPGAPGAGPGPAATPPAANVPRATAPAATGAPTAAPPTGIGTYIPGVPDARVQQYPGLQFLATLPPQVRPAVYSMIEGRTKMPSENTRNPQAMQQRLWAMQADPTLNDERYDLYKKFTNDPNIDAINRALGHASVLGQAIFALQSPTPLKSINSLAQRAGVEIGDTPTTTFNTIVHRYGPEIAKAYVAGGGSAGERGTDEKDFDPSLGPAQLAANLQITVHLLRSAIASKENQWKQNAAPWMDFTQRFIMPEAQKTLNTWDPQGYGGGQQGQQIDLNQFFKKK